eukprot:m.77775 g.77775  ORF g.77775 m.77775 type:complete len:115 (+) comp10631_c0_seq2:2666-3010(+)
MSLFQGLFEKHLELVEIFQIVFLYHVASSAVIHTLCGFAAMFSFWPDMGKKSIGAIFLFPFLALMPVVTYGALTSYLIAQVFVSSDQVMQHWIAIVCGVGQTFIQLFLGVAKLD